MGRVKLCYKEECGRRVRAVGLCALHYELLVFDGETDVLSELEALCANPVCAAPVTQKRDELGNVLNRNLYCTRCRNVQNKDGNAWTPTDEWFTQDCTDCGSAYSRSYLLKRHGRCNDCRELAKQRSRIKQLAYQRERRRKGIK